MKNRKWESSLTDRKICVGERSPLPQTAGLTFILPCGSGLHYISSTSVSVLVEMGTLINEQLSTCNGNKKFLKFLIC